MGEVVSRGLGIKITLDDKSDEVKEALKNAIERGLEAIGETAEGYAKDAITSAGRVDTGRMRNSITFALAGKGPNQKTYEDDNHKKYTYKGKTPKDKGETPNSVYVGTNVEYAPYHEMGTSRGIKAVHFLKRSITEHTSEYKDMIKESLENA